VTVLPLADRTVGEAALFGREVSSRDLTEVPDRISRDAER
jgi:hypothetical protein